ncbi:MAG: hypothetical protein JW798_07160 [Prolixibacteraceae bacterium]|nr:hypothetical protein [Prolixibacteraceae bacterium]
MNKRKINILITALLLPLFTLAQGRIAEIWTQPAVFNADEQVTFFFDLTGTDLANVAEQQGVCVWTWYPSDPGESWGNPSDASKLSHVEGNIWKWDLVPTEFYGVSADVVDAFYGQLQTHSGNNIVFFAPDQNPPNHITMYGLNTIKAEDAIIDYYPKQFSLDRPVSILLNANHVYPDQCGDNPVMGELAAAPNVHVHSGIDNWSVIVENNPGNIAKTGLTHLGDGIYRWDFIPREYFGLDKDYVATSINAVFASSDWAYIGKNVNCTDFYIEVPEQEELPIPELNFFPSKFSKKDIICIIRSDNEPYVSSMTYTITAGSKTITGSFEGNNSKLSAYINLADELKDAGSIDKINIVLIDNTGRTVSENDIPLVQLND